MKLKLPSSVQIKGPSGETIEVSAAQVIEHVVRTGRALGLGNEVDQVRIGARILSAVTGGDLAEGDLAELKKALTKPSRGWVTVVAEFDVPVPATAQNPTGHARQKRHFEPSRIDILPLIEALLAL
jgi:hypothetical protein